MREQSEPATSATAILDQVAAYAAGFLASMDGRRVDAAIGRDALHLRLGAISPSSRPNPPKCSGI